jgi:polysaccharide pyruvyl transferase WcaK-like protein
MATRAVEREGSPKVLLVGYNGANNTGAEALLLADIADLRAVLGANVSITVPTLNAENLRRYLREGPNLRIAPVPPIFFAAVRKLVREHDLVILVEGSAYMDTWTSALLWFFLWATHCAHSLGKPCLAYAVDAGSMSPFNQRLTRWVASRTGKIITRARAAAERLRSWGVTAPMDVTADNALRFRPNPADQGWVRHAWPEARGLAGLAVVNFHLFPVGLRLWGSKERCYRWPYYFAHSPQRERAADALASTYAQIADDIVAQHGKSIALIAMEQVDETFARKVLQLMEHSASARVFSSREYNASKMTELLRSLDVLVTSRFHASVLSLAAQVPQIAVGHDLRLETLYQDLGLRDRYFQRPTEPGLAEALKERIRELLVSPAAQRKVLQRGFAQHLARATRNRDLLDAFLEQHGWSGLEVAA